MLPKAHITFDDCCDDNECDCNWIQCMISVVRKDDFNSWLYLIPKINRIDDEKIYWLW